MTHSVIRSAEEIDRLEMIARMAATLMADDRNKIISAYRMVLEPLLKDVK